jgi:hypothetical protein
MYEVLQMGKETAMTHFELLHCQLLEMAKKGTDTLSYSKRCSSRDSNRIPLTFKSVCYSYDKPLSLNSNKISRRYI